MEVALEERLATLSPVMEAPFDGSLHFQTHKRNVENGGGIKRDLTVIERNPALNAYSLLSKFLHLQNHLHRTGTSCSKHRGGQRVGV